MKNVTQLISKISTSVTKMKIKGLPRLFVLLYAGIFISLAILYLTGLVVEFVHTGKLNYAASNQFASTYYGMALIGAFGVIGRAMLDSNDDGIPDAWQKDKPDKPEGKEEGPHGEKESYPRERKDI